MKKHSKALWSVLALVIAVLTVRAVFMGSGMTLRQLREGLESVDPLWMFPAVLCMFGIIYFEGEALRKILRSTGFHPKRRQVFLYSAADAYFSAITPSATGGQPASAFFMIRDGISGPVAAAALLLNLMMYTVSLVVCGLISILVRPLVFFRLSPGSKLLIAAGLLVIVLQVIVFWLVLKKPLMFRHAAYALIGFLHRIHLMHKPEKWKQKVLHMLHEYDSCVKILSGHRNMLWYAFAMNMLQRASQFTGVIFVYRALGGSWQHCADLWVIQCLVYIGVYCVPIPGSMGVTDALMLDGYLKLMTKSLAFQVQMIWRGLSFYLCVGLSGLTVLAGYLHQRRRKKERAGAALRKKQESNNGGN